jgi:hypothetical protein
MKAYDMVRPIHLSWLAGLGFLEPLGKQQKTKEEIEK